MVIDGIAVPLLLRDKIAPLGSPDTVAFKLKVLLSAFFAVLALAEFVVLCIESKMREVHKIKMRRLEIAESDLKLGHFLVNEV